MRVIVYKILKRKLFGQKKLIMKNFLLFLIIAGVLLCTKSYGQTHPGPIIASDTTAVVKTTSGKIIGYIDDATYVFKGIPYAKAERFLPPEKPDSWEGVKKCRVYGPISPQSVEPMKWRGQSDQEFVFRYNRETEDEKELFCLNVWTPGLKDGKKRPILVWFHGGGYFAGSGNNLDCYQGQSLSQRGDIVVITVNHRLNVLGFTDMSACGKKYAKSANVSVLDMIASLEWVRDNIEQFGGDPNNVTIAGQSGGGGKVMTLLVAPSAKGLFKQAIVQSGAMMGITKTSKEKSQVFGLALLDELKIAKEDVDKISNVPYPELMTAAQRVIAKTTGSRNPMYFAPSIDGEVLPYDFFDLAAKELYKDIPLLIGTTFNELVHIYNNEPVTREQTAERLKSRFGDDTGKLMDAFLKAYPNGTMQDILSIDMSIRLSTIEKATQKYTQSKAPVYVYLFNWKSPVLNGQYSACHNMELPFMFNNIAQQRELTGSGEDAYVLADKMSGAWINFVKSGDPNSKGLPKWEAFTPETNATMIFDNKCELKINHDREMLKYGAKYLAPFMSSTPPK